MPSVRAIVAALALLTPFTPIHAATPAEVEVGKVEGFTGGTAAHSGDYLISTFCFCAEPTPIPQHYSEANYLQFEYYNFHHNITYILDHLCLADQDAPTTCLAPRDGEDTRPRHGVDWPARLCRTWYSSLISNDDSPHHRRQDTLCYEMSRDDDLWREWRPPGRDVITFNGQTRHLDPVGRQGPVLKGKEMAEEKCDWLCDQHAGMPALRFNERAQCHVVVYEDLDDMCDGCA
ncbi:MAG: hypothetical protein Q9175_007352 [Cornicularia normoerica]